MKCNGAGEVAQAVGPLPYMSPLSVTGRGSKINCNDIQPYSGIQLS